MALKSVPGYVPAHIEKGRSLKRLGKYQDALLAIDDALGNRPNKTQRAIALYNRACYKTLLGNPVDEILSDLQNAINESPVLRVEAKKDPDLLSRLENEDRFKKLVKQPDGQP